ncbi:MAG: subclass B1 metallo-beta-lactamase [Cyclobacteriaceae bacterium]
MVLLLAMTGLKTQNHVYQDDSLRVEQLTENTFQHITYLRTQDFGNVACNGMIVRGNGEAIIFDTPSNDEDSKELIDWVENTLQCKVVAIVATHFHIDCLGGLNEFHSRKIPSYASNKTIDLAKGKGSPIPQYGFDGQLELKVGDKKVINAYAGEGHTQDNIVGYFPSEKVLFGGCMIKSMGAGKGNLEDANVKDWPKTVKKVKTQFADAQVILPGHGDSGGQELLDFTIKLFAKSKGN